MDKQKERDAHLIFVATAPEYGLRHHMPVKDVLSLFEKYDIADMLYSQYEMLHTADLSEGTNFAESFLQGVI